MILPVLILLLIFFSFLLIKSADLVLVSLKKISQSTKTGLFALSAIFLALGTSLPELFVGLTSALEGVSNLSLGIVVGSNIANISLVVGFTSFYTGKVLVRGEYVRRDVAVAFVAGVLPVAFVLDGFLSQVDGLVLLAVYGVYATGLFKKRYKQIAAEDPQKDYFYKFVRRITHINGREARDYIRLFLGLAVLLFSADMIVKLAQTLAIIINIPVLVVGMLILAVGTSLPEIVFSLRSLEDHTPSMFFGNILGSIIANSTLVIGLVSVIRPIKIVAGGEYFEALFVFVLMFGLFWWFIKSKNRLDRWEGFVLLVFYFAFVIWNFV